MTPLAVDIANLQFAYGSHTPAVKIPALQIPVGERVFLHGPSGSGKTTLLGLIGGVLNPNDGQIKILSRDLAAMTAHERDRFRGDHIGFIFQMFNLIPYLSVSENILLPCHLSKQRLSRMTESPREVALRWAKRLGLETYFDRPVTSLSVGQQQRVAAIRALMGKPELVIADEPTSSLDADRREEFIKLLFELCDEANATLIFVSHDLSLRTSFSSQLSLASINTIPPAGES